MRGSPARGTPEAVPVARLVRELRGVLEGDRRFRQIWVSGEVLNLTRARSGHIYFTLAEGGAALRCVFFRSRNAGQEQRLEDGAAVLAYGSLSIYEERGDLQLIVDFVQPAGAGAAAAEFERRRARFEREGLFSAARKRALPRFPRRVAVVTSPQGAVLEDVRTVLARRWPLATLLVQPTPVQGAEAAGEIAAAIASAAAPRGAAGEPLAPPEVVIVARGGGAAEDLWAFNEEAVVRAIFGCPLPVVSAVGHEGDVTLADLVADVRAPTPSAAAELVAPDRAALAERVARDRGRLHAALGGALDARRARLRQQGAALARALPDCSQRRLLVRAVASRMARAAEAELGGRRAGLGRLWERVAALSPDETLARGYALVSRPDGSAVVRSAELSEGERLLLRLRDGVRGARVESPP